MLTLIETRMGTRHADLDYRCSDGQVRTARMVGTSEPVFLLPQEPALTRALERWSERLENEPLIDRLQQALRAEPRQAPAP
jgi:hypothetical protein